MVFCDPSKKLKLQDIATFETGDFSDNYSGISGLDVTLVVVRKEVQN